MIPKAHLAEQTLQNRLSQPIDTRGRAYFVPKGKGRRLAISDIHGSFETFSSLLDKVGLNKDDQLFLLGDFIDRGPYSRLVVKFVKSMIVDGYDLYPLRGNHEQLFLDFNRAQPHKLALFAERQNAGHMLRSSAELWPGMDRFFGVLPYYYETDQHFLVHAGFDTRSKKPTRSWHHMLWTRQFEYSALKYQDKRIIHGHVPHLFKRIEAAIGNGANICPIDNACVRAGHQGYGRLVCADLDSGQLWKMKNIDTVAVPNGGDLTRQIA
jgi:serine/threonine protein phosphatase 1